MISNKSSNRSPIQFNNQEKIEAHRKKPQATKYRNTILNVSSDMQTQTYNVLQLNDSKLI